MAPLLTLYSNEWQMYLSQTTLIPRQIDFATTLNGLDSSFKGLIDTKHVGVSGNGFGGYLALAAAGARFNYDWVKTWCTDHKADPGYNNKWCSDMNSHASDLLALAKLTEMPKDGLWPSSADARVTSVVSLGGDNEFGSTGLASVTVPLIIETGSQDLWYPPKWNADPIYDNAASMAKVQVMFDGADAQVFLDSAGWTSPDHLTAPDLINHFTTAFLLDTLKGDKDAHKALLPDAVKFTGIGYKTTMK